MLIDVLGAALHPRTRSSANGSHYTSTGRLPMIPGFDGIGRDPDRQLRYFILDDPQLGSMAERVMIDTRRSVLLPTDTDVLSVAAAMNPAMSSWDRAAQPDRLSPRTGRARARRDRQRRTNGRADRQAARRRTGDRRRPRSGTSRRPDRTRRRQHRLADGR